MHHLKIIRLTRTATYQKTPSHIQRGFEVIEHKQYLQEKIKNDQQRARPQLVSTTIANAPATADRKERCQSRVSISAHIFKCKGGGTSSKMRARIIQSCFELLEIPVREDLRKCETQKFVCVGDQDGMWQHTENGIAASPHI